MNRTEIIAKIAALPFKEFFDKISFLKISEKRARQFFDIINASQKFDNYEKFDIEEIAIKLIYPEIYTELRTLSHLLSFCEFYEFDPAKNGQNLIKHGIGFSEVVSYSTKFGTLLLPCPDPNDSERVIIFSDLVLTPNRHLMLPLSKISGVAYTITIATHLRAHGGRFRFISSRFLSSKKDKFKETIGQSLRSVEFANEDAKNSFINRSVEIIERHLIMST